MDYELYTEPEMTIDQRKTFARIIEVSGFTKAVRWDENWVTYTLTRKDVPAGKIFRGHEEDLPAVRARVMAHVLGEYE